MGDSEKKKEGERKWILIVCGKVYCIICKMFMWHVWIGVCKIGVLHPVLIEFNLWNKIVLYGGLIPVNRFRCLTIVTLNLKKKKKMWDNHEFDCSSIMTGNSDFRLNNTQSHFEDGILHFTRRTCTIIPLLSMHVNEKYRGWLSYHTGLQRNKLPSNCGREMMTNKNLQLAY